MTPERKSTKDRRAKEQEAEGYIDLQLSATLVEPIESAAISPGDELLRRVRSSARFHFRHDPTTFPGCMDLEADDLPRLAVAARATASFPVAFDGAVVRSTRPGRFLLRGRRLGDRSHRRLRPRSPSLGHRDRDRG